MRKKAKVEGRFHDARHAFIEDLAESDAADEVIRNPARHISKDMLKYYSHIRTQAKRNAVAALVPTKTSSVEGTGKPATVPSDLEGVLQESLQVGQVN